MGDRCVWLPVTWLLVPGEGRNRAEAVETLEVELPSVGEGRSGNLAPSPRGSDRERRPKTAQHLVENHRVPRSESLGSVF